MSKMRYPSRMNARLSQEEVDGVERVLAERRAPPTHRHRYVVEPSWTETRPEVPKAGRDDLRYRKPDVGMGLVDHDHLQIARGEQVARPVDQARERGDRRSLGVPWPLPPVREKVVFVSAWRPRRWAVAPVRAEELDELGHRPFDRDRSLEVAAQPDAPPSVVVRP